MVMAESIESKSIQERVSEICNELYSGGTKPSVRIVLAELPDVKSTSTVHKYFANWKKELEANQQSLYERLGFSSEFTQSFMKEITRFGVEAEQRYKQQAQDANEQRDQAVSDLAKSEDKLHTQAAVVTQQEKEIKELQNELLTVKKNLEAELAKEKKASEATISEIRQQLSNVTKESKALSQQNESLRTDIAKAELKLEGNQEFVNEVKTQNAQLSAENKEFITTISDLNKTIASQESTMSGNDKLIQTLQSQQATMTQRLASLESNNTKLQNELSSLHTEFSDVNEKLSEEKDNFAKQVALSNEAKTSFNEQIKVFEQTVRSHEATISGNNKLIAQMEKSTTKIESTNKQLEKQLYSALTEVDSWTQKHKELSDELTQLKKSPE